MNDFYVIIAHPKPEKSISCKISLTALKKLENTKQAKIKAINLYDFNIPYYSGQKNNKLPKDLSIITREMKKYRTLVFVYPVWWSNMPAILKNFFDWSVFFGVDYDFKDKLSPLHKHKKAIVMSACGASSYTKNEKQQMRNIIDFNILNWWGIKETAFLLVEGTNNISKSKVDSYINIFYNKLRKYCFF